MPRPTGATGAMAAGAVALDGMVGFGQALGAPPLPRPFPMVGVVATGGAAVLTAEKKAEFWDRDSCFLMASWLKRHTVVTIQTKVLRSQQMVNQWSTCLTYITVTQAWASQ